MRAFKSLFGLLFLTACEAAPPSIQQEDIVPPPSPIVEIGRIGGDTRQIIVKLPYYNEFDDRAPFQMGEAIAAVRKSYFSGPTHSDGENYVNFKFKRARVKPEAINSNADIMDANFAAVSDFGEAKILYLNVIAVGSISKEQRDPRSELNKIEKFSDATLSEVQISIFKSYCQHNKNYELSADFCARFGGKK